jgi:hypothetical protein
MPSHAARASSGATPGGTDLASRDQGHRRHRVHTAGTSGSVATVSHTCPPGLLGAADRVHDDSPGVVHRLDVAAGIPHINETIRMPASRAWSRRR